VVSHNSCNCSYNRLHHYTVKFDRLFIYFLFFQIFPVFLLRQRCSISHEHGGHHSEQVIKEKKILINIIAEVIRV
jgi:hypothetical protein